MKDFFERLVVKGQKSPPDREAGNAARRIEPQREGVALYKKGDVIGGQYEVHGTLGEGGFGVVYLVQVRDTRDTLALKTFRDELLADPAARANFKKEALLWVNLERHPFVVAAEWVDEASGRLFVAMEYVAHDAQGRVTLADHLARADGPLDINQTLKWAIQFCLGMEHARAHGIECHRDIKPSNILIAPDETLRVSDFGLALAAEAAWRGSGGRGGSLVTGGAEGGFGFSLMLAEDKLRCGTPGYIAPEVYRCEGASVRSDIYSFGLVLWQMAAGSSIPPFLVPRHGDVNNYLCGIYEQQMAGRVPLLKDPLGTIIERCLRPRPSERYGNFQKLREALEPIWIRRTGRTFEVPHVAQRTAGFWSNKGAALKALDRHEDALGCYDKALALEPQHATTWINKGATLDALNRHQEAIECFDKALAIDPQNATTWYNKGAAHRALGEMHTWGRWFPEAIRCFDKALEIDPHNAAAWNEKGLVHRALGRESGDTGSYVAALVCFDKALAVDPLYLNAWGNKADTLNIVRLHEDAISCCEKALGIDSQNASLWYNKALAEDGLRYWREAMGSYQKFVELAPPQFAQQIAYARQRIHELCLSR